MKQHSPSRFMDQYVVRFPDGLRDRIKRGAAQNHRSMNAEINYHLGRVYPAPEAATGEGIENQAPAAVHQNTALQGSNPINHG